MKDLVFISSVQKELAAERRALRDFIRGDALLSHYFDVFLFEDLPAADRRADEVYLEQVDQSAIYVGIFGNEYGWEDADGVSPTEREFDRATQKQKNRLIFVKGSTDDTRHPKMLKLIKKAEQQLIRRRFTGVPDLTAALYASLVEHLRQTGDLRTLPFDAAACPRAGLADLSEDKLKWFLGVARRQRQYALDENTPVENALAHLNLLERGHPTHAAVLLFGREPQRFLLTSDVKCLHFHGTEIRKPIPSYQVYKGTVFDLVDQAVDFVMSKITRWVGTREHGPQAPVEYELPRKAVAEAIVNAVAHRDYASHASVQVMLFADRLEVWNPGQLPPALTPEQLRLPHASIPRNPLLAEPLFLTRYIERAGTGTLDMIALCREAGLPEPEFRQDGGQFVLTLWRDWLTQDVLAGLGLNDRQMRAIALLKTQRRITTGEYQKWVQCPRRTAARDLDELVTKGVVQRVGSGRSTHYVPLEKRAINVPNVPSSPVAPQTTSLPATTAKQGAKGPSRKPGRKRATKGTKGTATTRRASKGNKRAKKK